MLPIWAHILPKWVLVKVHSQVAIDPIWVGSYSIPMPTDTIPVDPVAVAAKAVMAERGISAEWLAKKLNMKNRTVLDFINQRRGTRRSTRLSICRELGIDHEQSQATA